MSELQTNTDQSIKTLTPDIVRLKANVEGLIIDSDDVMDKSSDLMKTIKTLEKSTDAEEKKYTKPLVDVTKQIRDNFRPIKSSLSLIIQALKSKQGVYLKDKRKRQEDEAAKQQAEFEANALKQAESLQDLGLGDAANQVVETASNFQVKKAPTKSQGKTATTSLTRSLNFEVDDFKNIPDSYKMIDKAKIKDELIELKDDLEKEAIASGLNKAKAKEFVYDNISKREFIRGVKIIINESVSTR